MKLEYIKQENKSILIMRDGQQVGAITGGEKGIGGSKFWAVTTGAVECPPAEFSYWLKDTSTMEYVNCNALSTLNQAKALAEYHFNK